MGKSNLSKKTSQSKISPSKQTTKVHKADKFIDVDRRISGMAKKVLLIYSGENAFRRSIKRGLSVMVIEDGGIYRVHPDGTRTLVKKQPQVYRDSKTGKFYRKKL